MISDLTSYFMKQKGLRKDSESLSRPGKAQSLLAILNIKKPLSNKPAEASPPKGVVLLNIIGRSPKNSNGFSFFACQGETYE